MSWERITFKNLDVGEKKITFETFTHRVYEKSIDDLNLTTQVSMHHIACKKDTHSAMNIH